ncbi:MAG TPA: DUF87 domain-containing protein [Candidatus Cybelea sp.]|nr:DUF87 domain-containing protein [Candidatus Cybelea sp.]
MDEVIGRVTTVGGSRMTVSLDGDRSNRDLVRVGSLVKAFDGERAVVAIVSEEQAESPGRTENLLVVNLLGEIAGAGAGLKFSRGVSTHPVPGAPVYVANDADLRAVYGEPGPSNAEVGTLYQDAARPALILTDELLTKHFAIVGTTGSGKSCALTVILSAILAKNPKAHVVLIDPHNEYAGAFGEVADVIRIDNLQLPLWLFNFEEACKVLIRGGTEGEQQSQALILSDAMAWARRNYTRRPRFGVPITVDTPVPFRVHELLRFINEEMGKLTKPDTSVPYLRLKARIELLRHDRRFEFLFSSEEDILAEIIGRLLRVPVNDKPLTIVDLSGVPSEIADVIVSTLSRILFDFSIWAERDQLPPVLLACEEAHRYVPSDERLGFAQTVRIITQIAKEGRKYGISLALITQRPSELSLAALSQCGTVFALRLGSDTDQQFIARTVPDIAREMLSALPSLPTQQAIVSGEGVKVPMRIRFADLPPQRRPHSEAAEFTKAWRADTADHSFIERGILRWRTQNRT